MSSSVFVPKEYAWDAVRNDWKECIRVVARSRLKENEIYIEVEADITMLVPHPCGQPGVEMETTLQLYPSFRDDKPNVITGFHFSGFYTSCQSVIRTLGMPADTEIY